MIKFSAFDLVLREIGNGIWSGLSFLLMIAFARYAWRNRQSYRDPTVEGAIGLFLYFLGSTVSAFLGWGAAAAARRLTWPPEPWANSWPLYAPSLLLSAIGAAWCLAVFIPTKHRTLVMTLFLIALATPIAFAVFKQ